MALRDGHTETIKTVFRHDFGDGHGRKQGGQGLSTHCADRRRGHQHERGWQHDALAIQLTVGHGSAPQGVASCESKSNLICVRLRGCQDGVDNGCGPDLSPLPDENGVGDLGSLPIQGTAFQNGVRIGAL